MIQSDDEIDGDVNHRVHCGLTEEMPNPREVLLHSHETSNALYYIKCLAVKSK